MACGGGGMAGLTLRMHVRAPDTDPISVTRPPADPRDSGEPVKLLMMGDDPADTELGATPWRAGMAPLASAYFAEAE